MTTPDFFARLWEMLVGRFDGPLSFRFMIQPAIAAFFAIRSGLRDAREGKPPYFFWSVFMDAKHRPELLGKVRADVGKVFIIALAFDLIYEWMVYRRIYPLQAILVAAVLAIIPYLLLRGPVTRIARRFKRF
jgi:hypothetical protein